MTTIGESTSTIGESRVRVKFNPTANTLVDRLKQKSAELIDMCESMKHTGGSVYPPQKMQEIVRLCELAQSQYEDAAMWAVKAATL